MRGRPGAEPSTRPQAVPLARDCSLLPDAFHVAFLRHWVLGPSDTHARESLSVTVTFSRMTSLAFLPRPAAEGSHSERAAAAVTTATLPGQRPPVQGSAGVRS